MVSLSCCGRDKQVRCAFENKPTWERWTARGFEVANTPVRERCRVFASVLQEKITEQWQIRGGDEQCSGSARMRGEVQGNSYPTQVRLKLPLNLLSR